MFSHLMCLDGGIPRGSSTHSEEKRKREGGKDCERDSEQDVK